jgi:hypothetical protein
MRKNSRIISLPFLTAFFCIVLALPAWGAQKMFGNMALVSQSDSNNILISLANIATFTSPVTAMARIGTWCGTPSKTNPCLIKILPGNYNLGSASLTMQPYVDIEGSGEAVTFISSALNSPTLAGVVNGADNSEIRFLTVTNTFAGTGSGVAIANKSQSPKITHVTAIVSGAMTSYALYNSGSAPTLNNVTALVGGLTGYGVYNTAASPAMNNVSVTATASFESFGVYDSGSSSPTMDGVTIKTDGHFSNGVYNAQSSPNMTNVNVTTRGLNSYAMTNISSAPVMNDVIISALPGTNGYGVSNESSTLTMSNVTVSTTGRSSCVSNHSSTVTADRSTIVGGINNDASSTMKIGGSRLVGGAVGDGATCAASYDGNFVALGANCR